MYVYIFTWRSGKVSNLAHEPGLASTLDLSFLIFTLRGQLFSLWPVIREDPHSPGLCSPTAKLLKIYVQDNGQLWSRGRLRFIWMLARGHPTRPVSPYQLCLRS